MVSFLAWYSREQWAYLKQVSADSAQLEDSFDEWEENAETAIQKFIAQGMQIRKVKVDVNQLVKWCKKRKIPIDSAARSQYALEKGAMDFES